MAGSFLHLRAPFAAYRPLQAGVFRGSLPTIPHSAAYGLLLNLAGIESRGDTSKSVTPMREGLPVLRLAVGERRKPEVATIFQQLHGYPVGAASKNLQEGTRGAKFHIAPARREVLIDFDVVVAISDAEDELLARVRAGLRGELPGDRYGLPFAGDNNLLFDRIDLRDDAPADTCWYTPVPVEGGPRPRAVRLTLAIDRSDSARTRTGLFAPEASPSAKVPPAAWVWTPSEPPSQAR